jgi:hypothetical protein
MPRRQFRTDGAQALRWTAIDRPIFLWVYIPDDQAGFKHHVAALAGVKT